MAQKLEASLNDMKMRMAEQMAEVARNRNRLLDIGTTLKERENTIAQQDKLLDERNARIAGLEMQIEENVKAINLAYAKMAQREDEHGKMQTVLKDAQSTLLLRDEKIRNLADETRALRELTTFAAQNHVANSPVEMSPQTFVAATNPGNPFEEPAATAEQDNDAVDRSVSNVLSLAERVRGLQTGMKKA